MAHIEDVYLGRWTDPRTGREAPRAAVDRLLIDDSLDGAEPDLVADAGLAGDITLVADPDTWDAMGSRVASRLRRSGRRVDEVLLERHAHATVSAADALAARLTGATAIVAVGSGTINDLTKFVTAQDGRPYCVFGTAASMDGYASTTASIELKSGLKTSLPAHSPKGVFLDLSVLAAAPTRMNAAGFGDCLCTSVARIDWWMSHRLWGGFYDDAPYLIAEPDAEELDRRAAGVGVRDHVATGWLTRALVLSGLGVGFTGVSNHGSMGEHQISHYIDCFAGDRHPGTTHGEQVGLTTLTMGRIQQWFLAQERPPEIKPTSIDPESMARRMGPEIAAQCRAEYAKKALDADGAARLNERLQEIWQELRAELAVWVDPAADMTERLRAAGGATTAAELGVPVDFYREAVRHGHEMRNRFSFADLACDAGLLDDFAAAEV
ncbi:MAG: iron-containing alcohol dehydrogenase [Pseudomonadota bacterium]